MIDIASSIDHTLLKANATQKEIKALSDEARLYQFHALCVNPCWVSTAKEYLKNSSIMLCTVIGFPLGANTSDTKAFEAHRAVEEGADEIDMVMNIGAAIEGRWDTVANDIASVRRSAKNRCLKVIIESALLTPEQIVAASLTAQRMGADFVKTSTGFAGGATTDSVALIRATIGKSMGIKASGGIKDYNTAKAMIRAGATRIGTSSGIIIVGQR